MGQTGGNVRTLNTPEKPLTSRNRPPANGLRGAKVDQTTFPITNDWRWQFPAHNANRSPTPIQGTIWQDR
jgi:hypothetical protein